MKIDFLYRRLEKRKRRIRMASQKSFPSARAQHIHVHFDISSDIIRHVHGLFAVVFPLRTTATSNPSEASVILNPISRARS